MGSLAKDTTEIDLWAFDDIQPLEDEGSEKAPKVPAPGVPAARPGKKPSDKRKPADEGGATAPGGNAAAKAAADSIKVNVGKARPVSQSGTVAGQSRPGSDFDDLDHWEDVEEELSDAPPPRLVPMPVKLELAPVLEPEPEPLAAETTSPAPAPEAEVDEFTTPVKPNLVPVSLRPHLGLSSMERVGLCALVGLLLIGAIVLYFNAIHGLQSGSKRVVQNDFPIKGKQLAIGSAETYWRAPLTGDVQETVRRGTVLIPEIRLKPEGGPAAIRVFFRNSDGDLVGDAVTRSVQTAAEIRVAATAGFEDIGMHAAYRTGQSKPWTVEVREAPSENSTVQEFQKLFEMDISTDRR